MRHPRALLTVLAVIILIPLIHGQRSMEIGLSTGPTFYHGDLGNENGIQWGGVRPGMAITVRNFLNNPKRYATRTFSMEGRLSWHRLGYDETKPIGDIRGAQLQNYGRGLNFRTDLYGASAHLVLNAYREAHQPMSRQKFFAFFYIGVGIFYGQPKADLFNGSQDMANRYHQWSDGTIRDQAESTGAGNVIERDGHFETNLSQWNTEGQNARGEQGNVQKRYSPWNIGIPMGFGIRYAISKKIILSSEYAFYSFFTDYLDDVSASYATRDQIAANFPNDLSMQQMAAYISDPTGKGTNGEAGPPYTSARGNPGTPDSFSYISVEVAYRFRRKLARRSFVSL